MKNQAIFILFSSFSPAILATETVAVPKMDYSEVTNMLGGLFIVLTVIFVLTYLLKKLNLSAQFNQQSEIKIISSLSLNAKDKLILIQVGTEQVLIGLSAQGIQLIKNLEQPIDIKNTQAIPQNTVLFSEHLKRFLTPQKNQSESHLGEGK